MVRRVLLLAAACAAMLFALPPIGAEAACSVNKIIGLWDREDDSAQLRFFSDNKVVCRLCDPKYPEGCKFIYDPTDDLRRKQCTFRHPDGKITTLSRWTATQGILDGLLFSDGTAISVSKGCDIDGEKGTMRIEGFGLFTCNYNYHCRNLER